MAEKLQTLCDDFALVEQFRNGVDTFILNKYSWHDVAKATAALYGN